MKNSITESKLLEFFRGELSTNEENAVREWCEASEDNRKLFGRIQQEHLYMRWGMKSGDVKVDYSDISGRITRKRKISRKTLVVAISAPVAAAALLLFILNINSFDSQEFISQVSPAENKAMLYLSDGTQHIVGLDETNLTETDGTQLSIAGGEIIYLNDNSIGDELGYNKVIIPRGADNYRIKLSDGSTVWLNSDSSLEYPLNFTGKERRVFLSGEGYFEVAHETDRPFIVESGPQSLTVLGTKFNISVYPNEEIVTTLVSGKIMVQPAIGSETVILLPGQQLSFNVGSGEEDVKNVYAGDYTSWKDGIIELGGTPFAQILNKIARKYDMRFELNDKDDFSGISLTGSIPSRESFETVLSILSKAVNVEFKPNKDGVIKVVKN